MSSREWHVKMNFSPKMYDVDAVGIVSNITYVRWLEDMRTEFLNQYIPWERLREVSMAPVLAETNIQYKNPLRMGEDVEGKLRVKDTGRTSWKLTFEFERDGQIVIIAEQTGVFVDLQTKKPARLPTNLRENMPDSTSD